MRADPKIFLKNEPCPDTPKYLEVQYNCVHNKYIDNNETSKLGNINKETNYINTPQFRFAARCFKIFILPLSFFR